MGVAGSGANHPPNPGKRQRVGRGVLAVLSVSARLWWKLGWGRRLRGWGQPCSQR